MKRCIAHVERRFSVCSARAHDTGRLRGAQVSRTGNRREESCGAPASERILYLAVFFIYLFIFQFCKTNMDATTLLGLFVQRTYGADVLHPSEPHHSFLLHARPLAEKLKNCRYRWGPGRARAEVFRKGSPRLKSKTSNMEWRPG